MLERVLPVVVGALLTVVVIGWLAGRVDEPRFTQGRLGEEVPGASLVAAGEDLLPPSAGSLARARGLSVAGNELEVVARRARGFFAGASTDSRVFVLWEGEPPPVGSTVDLLGVVEAAPKGEDPLDIGAAGAALVTEQGGYVAADEVQTDAPGATLVAGGQALLPPEAGALGAVAGTPVEGDELEVVARREAGFFAGASITSRVFVQWDGEQPPVGATVDVQGVAEGVPDGEDPLGIGAAGAEVVAEQGGYVRAEDVRIGAPPPAP